MNKWFRKAMFAFFSALIGCMALFGMTACDGCGECKHVWDEGTVTQQKTCTVDGEILFKCQECEETRVEKIPAAHDYVENVIEATCYSGGYSEKTCSVCGDYQKYAVTQEANCSYAKESVQATCTTDGYDLYTCKWCDKSYKNVTSRASGHKTEGAVWTVGEDELVGGCLYNHVETTTCTVCEETVAHYEPIYKHNYVVEVTPSTCTATGEKVYTCDDCGEALEPETIAIDTNAHSWDEGVLNEATGITTYTCSHSSEHTKQVVSFKTQVEATVPSVALKTTGQVELQKAEMKMDAATLAGLGDQDITLKADTVNTDDKDALKDKMEPEQAEKLGDSEVFNFTMKGSDDQAITTFGGKITVTVPYTLPQGEDPENIAIWFINDEGVPEAIQANYSVINNQGYATFETSHFSFYTVVRLTPAERCGLYGHKFEERTVAATCGVQGYTVKECKRCHALERSAFTPALAHNYKGSTIAPTCSAMGYTTYTCENCGDKYVSDYTAQTAHSYVDSVKAPTCTMDGYTTHTCSACGRSYTDNVVAATGHSYANGNCSVCGRKDPNAQTNFYFNLIESLAAAETYYLEISDLSVVQTQTYNNGDAETIKYEMKLARAQLGFDDKGVVGKGEGTLTGTRIATGSEKVEESYFADVEFLFKEGNAYVYITGTGLVFEGDGRTTAIMSTPQSSLVAQLEDEAGAEVSFTSLIQMLFDMKEGAGAVVNGMLTVDNSPMNSVIRAIVEYVFTKTETANGYSFELNENRLKEVYQLFNEKKVSEIFDLVFGEEAYSKVQAWAVASLDKKVSDVEAEAKTELARWGIDIEAVYDFADEIMSKMGGMEGAPDGGDGGVDYMADSSEEELTGIRAMIAEMKDVTVLQLLNSYLGEMTKEQAVEQINGYATQIGEMKIIDLMTASNKAEDSSAQAEEVEEEGVNVEEILDELVAYLNKIPTTFTTDKTGALIDFTMSVKDASAMSGMSYNSMAYETDVKQSMNVKFVVNGTFAGEFDHIIKESQVLAKANDFTKNVEGDGFTIYIGADGKTYAWMHNASMHHGSFIIQVGDEPPVEETKNGVVCEKVEVLFRGLYVLNEEMKDVIMATSDCEGWWKVSSSFNYYYYINGYIWYDAEGNVVASEVIFDGAEVSYLNSLTLYYNSVTGERASASQHNFKFVKKIDNEGCGYDYNQYVCTVCGMEKLEENDEGGHDFEWRYVLKEGSTNCEDGVYEQKYCETCGRIEYQYELSYHGYNYEEVLVYTSPVCGGVYARIGTCACGETTDVHDYYYWRTDCEIDQVDYEYLDHSGNVTNHDKYTYACAIQGCGFTFTREYKSWYEYDATAEETCTYHYQNTYVIGGKTYVDKSGYNQHRTSSSREDLPDGGYKKTYTCSLCNKVTSIDTYDEYGRQIRQENPMKNSGWYRVFSANCYYEQYTLEGNKTSSGTEHATAYADNGKNECTQYTLRGRYCRACDWKEGVWESPDYWYYDDHEYYWDGETYVCGRCGTENATGADGWIVLEDMLEDGVIKVGYFNKYDWWMDDAEITVMANYDPATEQGVELDGDLFTKEITSPVGRRESGIVTVAMNALSTAVQNLEDVEVETISVVFWVLDYSQTEVDPETGDPVPFYLAYALTFSVDEFGGFND